MKRNLNCYDRVFIPWHIEADERFNQLVKITEGRTVIGRDRLWYLYQLAQQAKYLNGSWFECGVFLGGSACMLACLLDRYAPRKLLLLFDTFKGMPPVRPELDDHKPGDFKNTSVELVERYLREHAPKARAYCIEGKIPESFSRIPDQCPDFPNAISLAHVDVDIYESVRACTEFIYPRLVGGGFILYDDYGFRQCFGARKAVDEFFQEKAESVIVLSTGQALVVKVKR